MDSLLALFSTIDLISLFAQDDAIGGVVGGGIGMVCCCLYVAVPLTILGFNIYMAVDAYTHESKLPEAENQAVLWILLCLLTGGIGSLVYFFVRRPKNR